MRKIEMKNCFFRNMPCQNCNFNRLHKKYSHFMPNLSLISDCHNVFRIMAQYLWSILSRTPNSAYDADAYVLIDIVRGRVINDDLWLAMRLCSVAIQSKLFLGLNKKSSMEAGRLLSYFELYLDRYCDLASEEEFSSVYCDYYVVRFQLIHLSGDYAFVTKEFENRLSCDDVILQYGRRVVSQYTASKWVGGNSKIERIKSRDVAENLMGDVLKRGTFDADDYFIIAKYLEHHIQSHTPGDGLKEVLKHLGSPTNIDDIVSSHEATNQAILYRDLYEASKRSGEDETVSFSYLSRAKRIADLFNLQDQKNKIRKLERSMSEEENKMKYNFTANQVNIIEGDVTQPIVYEASPNFDTRALKTDIDSLINTCDEDAKKELRDALAALDKKDESKFKKALEKACELCQGIFINTSSGVLLAYMRQNGLIS